MTASAPSPSVSAALPAMVAWLMAILAPLAGLVAQEFLHRPKLVGLIGPLWQRLMRIGHRLQAVRVGAAKRRSRAGEVRAERKMPRARLTFRRGWLVAELGYKGAAYRSQLEHLLAQPEMRAVIDAAPGFGRVLRPVCWMLGISRDLATSAAEISAVKVDPEGRVVPRKVDRPWPRPGRQSRPGTPETVVWRAPPVETPPRMTTALAWSFAKSR